MTAWRPINEAPKDGTWVLGCNSAGNQAVIIWSQRGLDMGTVKPGWIHPFTDGRLSPFWQGWRAVWWRPLPRSPSHKRTRDRMREVMHGGQQLPHPPTTLGA